MKRLRDVYFKEHRDQLIKSRLLKLRKDRITRTSPECTETYRLIVKLGHEYKEDHFLTQLRLLNKIKALFFKNPTIINSTLESYTVSLLRAYYCEVDNLENLIKIGELLDEISGIWSLSSQSNNLDDQILRTGMIEFTLYYFENDQVNDSSTLVSLLILFFNSCLDLGRVRQQIAEVKFIECFFRYLFASQITYDEEVLEVALRLAASCIDDPEQLQDSSLHLQISQFILASICFEGKPKIQEIAIDLAREVINVLMGSIGELELNEFVEFGIGDCFSLSISSTLRDAKFKLAIKLFELEITEPSTCFNIQEIEAYMKNEIQNSESPSICFNDMIFVLAVSMLSERLIQTLVEYWSKFRGSNSISIACGTYILHQLDSSPFLTTSELSEIQFFNFIQELTDHNRNLSLEEIDLFREILDVVIQSNTQTREPIVALELLLPCLENLKELKKSQFWGEEEEYDPTLL